MKVSLLRNFGFKITNLNEHTATFVSKGTTSSSNNSLERKITGQCLLQSKKIKLNPKNRNMCS